MAQTELSGSLLGQAHNRVLRIALLGASASWSCTNIIALGTECPELRTSCTITDAAVTEREDAHVAADGAGDPAPPLPDSGPLDAGNPVQPVDAGGRDGGGPSPLLALENPEFARNGLLDGDLMLYGLIGDIIPPSTLVFADVPGWYACGLFSVESRSALEASDASTGAPAAGETYISFVINNTPVRQLLPSPIEPGVAYALEMDVLSQNEGGEPLFVAVQGSHSQCGGGSLLGRTQPIPNDGQWTTVCASFRASTEHSHLLLVPAVEGSASPQATARLLLDNLRPVARCPE